MFTRDLYEEELKLLVSVANKTAYHSIKSYYARYWRTNLLAFARLFFEAYQIEKEPAILFSICAV